MGNPICYAEMHTDDPNTAKKFYGSLFAWKLQDVTIGKRTSTICHVGDGVPAGIQTTPPGQKPRWITFVQVDDINAKLAMAQKLGAKILTGATHVQGYGWFGIIMDPMGAELGLWKVGD